MRLAAWALAAGVLGAVAALPAQAPAPPPVQPSAGTLEMAALLEARAKAVGPADLWFNVNDRRAEAFAAALARRGGGADLVDLTRSIPAPDSRRRRRRWISIGTAA